MNCVSISVWLMFLVYGCGLVGFVELVCVISDVKVLLICVI